MYICRLIIQKCFEPFFNKVMFDLSFDSIGAICLVVRDIYRLNQVDAFRHTFRVQSQLRRFNQTSPRLSSLWCEVVV